MSLTWTVLPLALMLILAMAATAIVLQATVKLLLEQRNLSLVEVTALHLDQNLTDFNADLQLLAQEPDLLTLDADLGRAVFDRYAPSLTPLPDSGRLVVLDAGGEVLFTYPSLPSLHGEDFSTQPYFAALQEANPSTIIPFDLHPEPNTDRWIFGQAVPLYTSAGERVGSLVSQFYADQNPFASTLTPLKSRDIAAVYLVDSTGRVISDSPALQMGADFSADPTVQRLWQSNQAGNSTLTVPDRGRVLSSYAPVSSRGWGLVALEPWSVVLDFVGNALFFIGLALFVGLLGLSLVVLWAVQRITNRLRLLIEQTSQVAAGAYNGQVSLSRIPELRELGIAFNGMVNQLASYRRGLQEYVASVNDSQEEERKRIARDLHDGTIQTLIAIGQRIALVRDDLPTQSTEASQKQLTELRQMVTESVDGIRQFIRALRPLALEDLGLVPALHFLLSRLEQDEGIAVEFDIEGEAIGLPQELEITIYRLVQEVLSNVRKHAEANKVWLVLRFLPRQTIVEVRDNGIGFNVPENTTDLARNGSFGLLGLEERAHLFGGDLAIQSAVGQGSLIKVILPHEQPPRRRLEMGD